MLLVVKNLNVSFKQPQSVGGELRAVRDFNLTVKPGERIGLVGESGAGKSIAAFSILNLLKKPAFIRSGDIIFQGKSLRAMNERELNKVRGKQLSMIFQDPMITLNPLLTIGQQLIEVLLDHEETNYAKAKAKVLETLEKVKIPSASKRFDQYPHEFSGGMRQRIVIACSIITRPQLIVADEPTTALDVTIQAEIIELLYQLSVQEKVAVIFISHDLALVSQIAEKILVMYAGKIIEQNQTKQIIQHPRHPYTQGLMRCLPQNHPTGKTLYQIQGLMPSLSNIPETCSFYPRCERRKPKCQKEILVQETGKDQSVLCFYPNPK